MTSPSVCVGPFSDTAACLYQPDIAPDLLAAFLRRHSFVTSNSVEEDILERAKRKMVIDHLVSPAGMTSTSAVRACAPVCAACLQ